MKGSDYYTSPETRPIFSQAPPFVGCFSLLSGDRQKFFRKPAIPVFLGIKNSEVFSNDVACFISFYYLSARIPILNVPIFAEKNNRIVLNLFYHLMIAFLALLQLFIRLAQFLKHIADFILGNLFVGKITGHLGKTDYF